jgi:hypothetical protein
VTIVQPDVGLQRLRFRCAAALAMVFPSQEDYAPVAVPS